MSFTNSHKGSYRPSHLNPNRQQSLEAPGTGALHRRAASPPLYPTPERRPLHNAMSSVPLHNVSPPRTPQYAENVSFLPNQQASTGVGEAFMDLTDDDDDDEQPPTQQTTAQTLVKNASPPPNIESPAHIRTSPTNFIPASPSHPTNFHPSLNIHRQPSHPGLQRSPSRNIPSFTTLTSRSRPPSFAASDEVMSGLGLGSKPYEMPYDMDKKAHLILYELPTLSPKRQPSKMSSHSSGLRGPIAYAYDPTADMTRPADEEDRLHDPNARGLHDTAFPWRGVVNVAFLLFLLFGMMALFLFYPIYTHYGDADRQTRIQQIIDTDGYIP